MKICRLTFSDDKVLIGRGSEGFDIFRKAAYCRRRYDKNLGRRIGMSWGPSNTFRNILRFKIVYEKKSNL